MMRNVLSGVVIAVLIAVGTIGEIRASEYVERLESVAIPGQFSDPNIERLINAIESMSQSINDRLTQIELKIVEAPKAPVQQAIQKTPPLAPPVEPKKVPVVVTATTATCAVPPAVYTAPQSNYSTPAYTVAQGPVYTVTSPQTSYYGYPTYTTAPQANCAAPRYSTYSYSSPYRRYSRSNAPVQVQVAPAVTRSYQSPGWGMFGSSRTMYSGGAAPQYSYGYRGYYGSGSYCGPGGCRH